MIPWLLALGCLLSACIAGGASGASAGAGPIAARAEGRVPRTVRIMDFAFAPSELSVTAGDTLMWFNEDPLRHTTTADSAAWSSPELAKGDRFVFVANVAGRFPYHCAAHPVMRGVIVVRE